jgi:hypothetical protein
LRSERSTDGHSDGMTGARFALGGRVGCTVDGFATGVGGTGAGAGVGFCASLERAQTPSAAAMRVALIILASF